MFAIRLLDVYFYKLMGYSLLYFSFTVKIEFIVFVIGSPNIYRTRDRVLPYAEDGKREI